MKKLNYVLGLLALVAVGFWSSCSNDAAVAPTISVSVVGTPDYTQGSDVVYAVTAQTASDKDVLKTLTITGTGLNPNYTMSYDAATTMSTDTFTMTIPTTVPGGTAVELTFEATTDKDTSAVATQSFTVVSSVQTYTDVTLTYKSTDFSQANILDAATGTALKGDGDKTKFDVAFGYNGDPKVLYTLAAPNSSWLATAWGANNSAWSATGQNATKLDIITGFDFDNATLETLNAINVTSPTDGSKWNVLVGNTYGFITVRGQKGVIKIKSLGSVSKSTDATKLQASITVDVKVTPLATAK